MQALAEALQGLWQATSSPNSEQAQPNSFVPRLQRARRNLEAGVAQAGRPAPPDVAALPDAEPVPLAQALEVQHVPFVAGLVAQLTEKAAPYIALLALLFIFQHLSGVALYVLALASVSGLNMHMATLVASPPDARPYKVLDTLFVTLLNIWAVSILGQPDPAMLRTLLLQAPAYRLPLLDCIFYAAVAPLLLKQWMVVSKVSAVLSCRFLKAPPTRSGTSRQATLLTFLEYFSLAWTEAMPVPIWFCYLMGASPSIAVRSVAVGVYMSIKGAAYQPRLCSLYTAAKQLLAGRSINGLEPSQEEVLEAGVHSRLASCSVSTSLSILHL